LADQSAKASIERFERRAIEGIGDSTTSSSFETVSPGSRVEEEEEAMTVRLIVDPLIPVPFEVEEEEEEVSTTAE
jgi:hypothetical protein